MHQPESIAKYRQGFKVLNRLMLLNWRLGLGRWLSLYPEATGRYMVITHTGRKTGTRHRTPVNYAEINGELYCTAGFGEISDWYLNIKNNPQVEVWLAEGWWAGLAEEVLPSEEIYLPAMRQVLIGSGFVARLIGLDARTCSDSELAEFCRGYKLLRIRRQSARTGPEGPGDLSWVWVVATFLLLPLALRPRRRK